MFNLFNKSKPSSGEKLVLKISGMHCVACSLNIDTDIEELPGVFSCTTNYPKSETVITFDPLIAKPNQFKKIISSLGYGVE